jgi:hypothetical protein
MSKCKRIKVNRIDFDKAENDGFVYGKDLDRRSYNSVYSDLGQEKEYRPSHNDDSKTDYRFFINCRICYAQNDEQADLEKFVEVIDNASLIIYC